MCFCSFCDVLYFRTKLIIQRLWLKALWILKHSSQFQFTFLCLLVYKRFCAMLNPPLFCSCTLQHLCMLSLSVVQNLWEILPLWQWLFAGSEESQLIWIAAILLNYLGLWLFLLANDCVFPLCLRNEYVYDSILLQSCVQLYYICLEAMSIFFFTCTTNSSSSPALLHFLLVQQLFCFIVWSQHLMPLIH